MAYYGPQGQVGSLGQGGGNRGRPYYYHGMFQGTGPSPTRVQSQNRIQPNHHNVPLQNNLAWDMFMGNKASQNNVGGTEGTDYASTKQNLIKMPDGTLKIIKDKPTKITNSLGSDWDRAGKLAKKTSEVIRSADAKVQAFGNWAKNTNLGKQIAAVKGSPVASGALTALTVGAEMAFPGKAFMGDNLAGYRQQVTDTAKLTDPMTYLMAGASAIGGIFKGVF